MEKVETESAASSVKTVKLETPNLRFIISPEKAMIFFFQRRENRRLSIREFTLAGM